MKIKNIKRILKEDTKGERYLDSKLSSMGPMGISRHISNLGGYGQLDTLKKAEEEFYRLHRVEFKLNNKPYEGYFIVYPQDNNTLIFYDGLPFMKNRDTMYTGGQLNKEKSVIFTGSRVDLQLLNTYEKFLKNFGLKTITLKDYPEIKKDITENKIVDVRLFFERLYNLFKLNESNKTEFYKEINEFINIFNSLRNYPKSKLNRKVIDKYINFRDNYIDENVLEQNEFQVFDSYNIDDFFYQSRVFSLLQFFIFIKDNAEKIKKQSLEIIEFLNKLSNKNSTRISTPFISDDKYDIKYIVNIENNLLPGVQKDLKNQILEFTYISENLIDKTNYKSGKSLGIMKINSIYLDMNDNNENYKILFDSKNNKVNLNINGQDKSGTASNQTIVLNLIDDIFKQKFNKEYNDITSKIIEGAIHNKIYNFNYINNNNKHYRLGRSGASYSLDILFENDLDGTMFKGQHNNIKIISLQINDYSILKDNTKYINEIRLNIEFINN